MKGTFIFGMVLNLIKLFIVLSILAVGHTGFEKVVICVLILTYLNVDAFIMGWTVQQHTLLKYLSSEFVKIKKVLKADDETDEKFTSSLKKQGDSTAKSSSFYSK